MAIRLDELIYSVRLRLGDHVQEGYDTATGDSVTDRYPLTHVNLLEDSLSITVGGTPDLTATVDERSGWVRFSSIPADGAAVTFSYQYTVWSDERVTEALNAAIDELFGWFYVTGFNDTLWSEGGAEFVAQDSAGNDLDREDRITRVEYWNGSRWVRTDCWKVQVQEDAKVIVFENAPYAGTNFRISYVQRLGHLTDTSDTLEDAGFGTSEERAKEPLILFACADLITDRIHHRIRDDRAHNTQSENPVKSYEIQNDANYLRSLAQLKAQRLALPRLSGRVSY